MSYKLGLYLKKLRMKRIGGYCKTRRELTERLQNKIGQFELSRKERECLYQCDGWSYDKDCYKGEDIDLKGERNKDA